jgi:hypothetical protein
VNHFDNRRCADVLARYPAAGCAGKQDHAGPKHFAAVVIDVFEAACQGGAKLRHFSPPTTSRRGQLRVDKLPDLT